VRRIGAVLHEHQRGPKVFPGTYNESVELDKATGNISLIAVNNSGQPSPGVTINGGTEDAIATPKAGDHVGDITIDGFVVKSSGNDGIDLEVDGDVTIRNVTASGNGEDGVELDMNGDITITDCTASNNGSDGFDLETEGKIYLENCTANGNKSDDGFDIDGEDGPYVDNDVTLINCTANDNGTSSDDGDGFDIELTGKLTVRDCTANNNSGSGFEFNYEKDTGVESATITGCTANGNGGSDEDDVAHDGIHVRAEGMVTIHRCTANDNDHDGIDVENNINTEIKDCIAKDNGYSGIETDSGGFTLVQFCRMTGNAKDYDDPGDAGLEVDHPEGGQDPPEVNTGVTVSCCDFDGNRKGLGVDSAFVGEVMAEGNWWGDASGPSGIGPGSGDSIVIEIGGTGTVTYDPWLNQSAEETPGCWQRPIPTLSHYGAMALVLLMAATMFYMTRRRRNAG